MGRQDADGNYRGRYETEEFIKCEYFLSGFIKRVDKGWTTTVTVRVPTKG